MSTKSVRDWLLQKNWCEEVIPNLGNEQWVTVFQQMNVADGERLDIYSGLIPNDRVNMSMRDNNWEINASTCLPRFQWELETKSGTRLPEYDRFGWPSNRVEPLVIERSFYSLRPKTIEVSEEFRHFHNLYCESNDAVYCKIDEIGDYIPVVKKHINQIQIRRKELRQFLAVKNMSLALYFDRCCFSEFELSDLGCSATFETKESENLNIPVHYV